MINTHESRAHMNIILDEFNRRDKKKSWRLEKRKFQAKKMKNNYELKTQMKNQL